jgi:hypothetical protein
MGSDVVELNRLGLTLYIDTMIIDAPDDASAFLRRLHDEHWIYLHRTDAMDADLATALPSEAARLTGASAGYPEAHGPPVPGQTRQGHGVQATREDMERLELVRQILHEVPRVRGRTPTICATRCMSRLRSGTADTRCRRPTPALADRRWSQSVHFG